MPLLHPNLAKTSTAPEVIMVKLALLARMDAKPGKEEEAATFLTSALPLAQQESGTTVWFAWRIGKSTFGIFDAFADEAGRQAHLTGQIAAALMAKAPDLFVGTPSIDKLDVLAAKLKE
jgi:quinol monooxygenase YgiN